MKILIIDDSIDKISQLTQVINELPKKCQIDNAENISNAVLLLRENKYDLAIIDLYLPLRKNDEPNPDGGKNLLNEIYRKNHVLNIPNYIVGFSKYQDSVNRFSPIWRVIYYEPSSLVWRNSFDYLFRHIISTGTFTSSTENLLPTVFVEGLTDLIYLNIAKDIFFNSIENPFIIKSQVNAGANWVAGQIVIWGMQKKVNAEGRYVKSIALLDSDDAGNKAKQIIAERLRTQNEQDTFKVHQLLPKYNLCLLEFYKQKCKIEIEIEALFPLDIFKHAESMNWLEHRNPTFLSPPSDWEQFNQTSVQYIKSKGIDESLLLYTKKIKISHKKDFCNYVENCSNKEEIFKNFKPLIEDILKLL